MKAFQKLALVSAIAAAPFAQAEMVAIDDALMGEMTGQAGITIELDTAITIKDVAYTDTDGGANGAGTLNITGIALGGGLIGGSTSSVHDARLNDFKIDIDVDSTDGLVIHLGGTDSKASLLGMNPVDFGLSVDSVSSSGMAGNIASDIKIAGNLGPIDIKINNNNVNATDLIDVQAYFEVTSGSLNVDVIGLGITNLTIGQDSMPLLSTGSAYQQEARNALYATLVEADMLGGDDQATAHAANVHLLTADESVLAGTIAGVRTAAIPDAATDYVASLEDATVISMARAGTVASAEASWIEDGDTGLNAAGDSQAQVGIDAGLAFDGTNPTRVGVEGGVTTAVASNLTADAPSQDGTNMAFVSMTIDNGSANYTSLTEGDIVVDSALIVNLTSFNVDIGMDISMGSTDGVARGIGSVAIDDLNMSGTVLKIYGH